MYGRNASASDLDNNLAVKPVNYRMCEMAKRLTQHFERDIELLYRGSHTCDLPNTMALRSGKTKSFKPWSGVEYRDLGDRIYVLAAEYDQIEQKTKDKFDKNSPDFLTFNPQKAREWARRVNAAVSKKKLNNPDVP